MTTAELRAQRKVTRAFINTQPVQLTLKPRSKQRTSGGGYTYVDGAPREPQIMRLIEPADIQLPTVTLDGVQKESQFELLGAHDAVIGELDTFELDGTRYQVARLAPFNGWEQRAIVVRFG